MHWIKEVEMVDSVDDLKSSSSKRGIQMPKFWSNRCEDCFSTEPNHPEYPLQEKGQSGGRQIAYLIYEYFPVTGANDSAENYADLFTVVLQNDDIQEFDSKRDEILLSMTQIPPDEVLESLCKWKIRESEKLKTVLELYNMEIHQKKAWPHYHRWKTMVKRSIEQNLRIKNFHARIGNFETSAVVKNHRGQNSVNQGLWEIVGSGKLTGSVRKETIAVSVTISISVQKRHSRTLLQDLLRSRVWKMHREPEVPEAEAHVEECLGCFARITSKELAQLHSAQNGILRSACSTSHKKDAGGEKCSYAHRQVDEQPSKKSEKSGEKSAVAILKNTRQFGFESQDMEPPKSTTILRKS